MNLHPFIGLVGPSGSGKTTLITAAIRRLPEHVRMVRSSTTRPARENEDASSYDFVSVEEMLHREDAGRLINCSEYAGHLYGFDRHIVDETLATHLGLQAIVESAVARIRAAGYDLRLVRVIPEGTIDQRDDARTRADNERAKQPIKVDLELHNHFSPGGLEACEEEFIAYLKTLI